MALCRQQVKTSLVKKGGGRGGNKFQPLLSLFSLLSSFMVSSAAAPGSGDNKPVREGIHLYGTQQSGPACETSSQLKGLSSVSTLRCLYSLIQGRQADRDGCSSKPSETHRRRYIKTSLPVKIHRFSTALVLLHSSMVFK